MFISSFFIVTGFLIAPVEFAQCLVNDFPLVVAIIGAMLLGKWVAAEMTGRAFGYAAPARLTVWVLTLPQVAATLAATLVAYDTHNSAGRRLLDSTMLHAVLVLMLVTSILGPVLTERFTSRMLSHLGFSRLMVALAPLGAG